MEAPLLSRIAIALAVGAAIGFAGGNHFASLTRTDPAPEARSLNAIARLLQPPVINGIEDALKETNTRKRTRKLRLLLDGMDAKEIPKALDSFRVAKSDPDLFDLELEFLAEWAATDPHQALAAPPS